MIRVLGFVFRVSCFGFRVSGFRFHAPGSGFRVSGRRVDREVGGASEMPSPVERGLRLRNASLNRIETLHSTALKRFTQPH